MLATQALPLFRSEVQLRALGVLLLEPDREWTTAELAEQLGATPVSIHRELHRALAAGLLTRAAIGRTYVYRAAVDSPLYDPLRLLLERTVGVEAELRSALEDVPGVDAAFIHGSFAKKTRLKPTSDIDVLVLGHTDPHALRRRLRLAEARLAREIDLIAYTPDEFQSLAQSGNSLVGEILRGPVTPLIGTLDSLGSYDTG